MGVGRGKREGGGQLPEIKGWGTTAFAAKAYLRGSCVKQAAETKAFNGNQIDGPQFKQEPASQRPSSLPEQSRLTSPGFNFPVVM